MSHPSWVCGLKLRQSSLHQSGANRHTLRGCVDWNSPLALLVPWLSMSHPSWVCGLKLFEPEISIHNESHTLRGCVDWNFRNKTNRLYDIRSHPSWVCGLKHIWHSFFSFVNKSHPSWVCGLKRCPRSKPKWEFKVTPFVGVWIETISIYFLTLVLKSHPSWVCGLKPATIIWGGAESVTPFVGVWIETPFRLRFGDEIHVTPFVGVWIETIILWFFCKATISHTLRGCVDWNLLKVTLRPFQVVTPFVGVWIETLRSVSLQDAPAVTPFVGVWIETILNLRESYGMQRHTLRGCVDWNLASRKATG